MKHAAAALFALACASPLWAGELSARYEAMGTMSATIGDTTYEMVIPYDTEKDRGYAERKMIMGSHLTINTLGRVVDDSGKPGRPMIQVTLQQQSGAMRLLSAEMFDEQGYDAPLAMGPDGGSGDLTEFSLEGDQMQATVTGEFLRLTGYTGSEIKVADGAEPMPATINWSVTLPPME